MSYEGYDELEIEHQKVEEEMESAEEKNEILESEESPSREKE